MQSFGITGQAVEEYLYNGLPKRDKLLVRMEEDANRRGVPIVGPLAGRFLHILAGLVEAKRILEIGTATGYSAIWLGRAMSKGGKLITFEADGERRGEAQRNIREAGLDGVVEIRLGDGLELIKEIQGVFDMIFLDSDKEQYPLFLDPCMSKLRKGGLLVVDNCLWSGEVAKKNGSRATEAIRKFNQEALSDPRLFSLIVPIRDGVFLGKKL